MTVKEFEESAAAILRSIDLARAGQRYSSHRDIKVEFVMLIEGSEALPSVLPLDCNELDSTTLDHEVIQVQFDVTKNVLSAYAHWVFPDSGGSHVIKVITKTRKLVSRLDDPERAEIRFAFDHVDWRVASCETDPNDLSVTFQLSIDKS